MRHTTMVSAQSHGTSLHCGSFEVGYVDIVFY